MQDRFAQLPQRRARHAPRSWQIPIVSQSSKS
jgi:hypothetical protein